MRGGGPTWDPWTRGRGEGASGRISEAGPGCAPRIPEHLARSRWLGIFLGSEGRGGLSTQHRVALWSRQAPAPTPSSGGRRRQAGAEQEEEAGASQLPCSPPAGAGHVATRAPAAERPAVLWPRAGGPAASGAPCEPQGEQVPAGPPAVCEAGQIGSLCAFFLERHLQLLKLRF